VASYLEVPLDSLPSVFSVANVWRKCPQNVKISDMLEAVVKELEEPDLAQRIVMAKQIFQEI